MRGRYNENVGVPVLPDGRTKGYRRVMYLTRQLLPSLLPSFTIPLSHLPCPESPNSIRNAGQPYFLNTQTVQVFHPTFIALTIPTRPTQSRPIIIPTPRDLQNLLTSRREKTHQLLFHRSRMEQIKELELPRKVIFPLQPIKSLIF